MAELSLETVTDAARDAFYVTVGASVIAFQKLQVQRVELTKNLNGQIDDATRTAEKSIESARGSFDSVAEMVDDRFKLVEERLAAVESRLETVLAQVEDKLPEQARDLVKQARELGGLAA